MKPIIGIISRCDEDAINAYQYCYEYYSRAVIKNGGIPIMVLPTQNINHHESIPSKTERLTEEELNDLYQVIDSCDGIIMPGGDKWFQYDEEIARYALKKDIPLLGICMGMQLLGYVDNSSVDKTVFKTVRNETVLNHHQRGVKEVHDINIVKDSLLYEIVGSETLTVNSVHNYHIPKVTNFKVSAMSTDGLIEAIEDRTKKFALALQWHPEVLIETDEISNNIFKKFIESSRKN